MHPNKNITAPLISLFIIPLIIGDALVLGNVNSKTSILIIAPIIFILLTIFLITLYKITKQALFQYDNIFTELGFHKKRLYLILTTYEKKLGDSTLQIIYSPSRASYQSIQTP